MKLALLSLILALLTFGSGCAVSGSKFAASAIASAGDVDGHLDKIDSLASGIVPPHADADAAGRAKSIQTEAAAAKKSNASTTASVKNLAAHDAKETKIADDYDNSWTGGKTRRAFWTVVIIGVLVGILLIASDFLRDFAGPVGAIAGTIFGLFGGWVGAGVAWVAKAIGNFNDWFGAKVKGWFAKKPTAATTKAAVT